MLGDNGSNTKTKRARGSPCALFRYHLLDGSRLPHVAVKDVDVAGEGNGEWRMPTAAVGADGGEPAVPWRVANGIGAPFAAVASWQHCSGLQYTACPVLDRTCPALGP